MALGLTTAVLGYLAGSVQADIKSALSYCLALTGRDHSPRSACRGDRRRLQDLRRGHHDRIGLGYAISR